MPFIRLVVNLLAMSVGIPIIIILSPLWVGAMICWALLIELGSKELFRGLTKEFFWVNM